MKREEILRDKGYWIAKLQVELYDQLKEYLDNNGINQSQLAKKLGVSKGYISQIMNGDFNHRLSTLVELSLAIGKVPDLSFMDLNQLIDDDDAGIRKISWTVSVNELGNSQYEDLSDDLKIEIDTDFNSKSNNIQPEVNFS